MAKKVSVENQRKKVVKGDNMDSEQIIQSLNARFVKPLPEFYQRRIVFWIDEDREFEDIIGDLQLDKAKVLILNGHNSFAAKQLLVEDDPTSNYLVYCPVAYQRPEDDWLLNIRLYSEEYRADLNSIWMDEMGLPATPVLRTQVKGYRRFFNAKDRRAKVAAMSNRISTAAHLHTAVMSVLCGLKEPNPNGIIRTVLSGPQSLEDNETYQSFVNYGSVKAFWVMVAQASGYQNADDPDLRDLMSHILLTAASRTLSHEVLAGLEQHISVPHQTWCYDFVTDWLHSDSDGRLYRLARELEHEYHLPERFAKFEIADLLNTECFPCINECIISAMMAEIQNDTIQPQTINSIVERRRAMIWYDYAECYYEGLQQVANMLSFRQTHVNSFHIVDAEAVWKEYTTDLYRMDTWYRNFHLQFQKSLHVMNSRLDDGFKAVADKVEGLYNHWFLAQLSACWTNASEIDLKDTGCIPGVKPLEDFYADKVKPAETRVFVIISDAMRYEVAAVLAEQLRRETQSKVILESRQGISPTITPFGMAALLPHKELNVQLRPNGQLQVLCDGMPSEAGDRDGILKAANPHSVALQYKKIIDMKRQERTALVKGMDVIYIYHDRIDEASHSDDAAVFSACEHAIQEIKTMVRIIVNEFSGVRILITADHGFLYTYSPLTEESKTASDIKDQTVEMGRRYVIAEKGADAEYMMPVRFLEGHTEYDAFVPRENIRLKMSGAGVNFVHGGASLQEMAVPVIDYTYKRTDSKDFKSHREQYETKPVTVSLISATRKISNMLFALNFYQQEPVGDTRSACNYRVFFRDASGKVISDTLRIIADKTTTNEQQRTFRMNFNLKPQQYSNLDTYYLVIQDEEGKQMPVIEEFQIDIAFAADGFDFFS